jgi:hypothetical protein
MLICYIDILVIGPSEQEKEYSRCTYKTSGQKIGNESK